MSINKNITKDTHKKAALYVRVSTNYQIDKDSLPMQRQELVAYAKLMFGIDDYVIFEDAGYSGKNTDRPEFQNMMRRIRSGEFTHLLCWKIDRISRNLLDFASMYQELKDLGVTFVSKNEQFDTSTAIGEAMLKIILVFAELERNMTSERVTATMLSRAQNGLWNGGRVPFGYDYDKESKSFSINPEESALVKRMFDLYTEHRSIVMVSRTLNEDGYASRAGNDWSPVSVFIILTNPFYTGMYRYNHYKDPGLKVEKDQSEWIEVPNHHPRIISDEQFQNVNRIMQGNSRSKRLPGQQHTTKNTHIFGGLIYCGTCGSLYVSTPSRLQASGYRPSKYSCPNLRKKTTCNTKSVSDPVIGEFMINYVLNMMHAKDNFSSIHNTTDLQNALLRGGTFQTVDHIGKDGLESYFHMLTTTPLDGKRFRKPKKANTIDPELKRLRAEKRKTERAMDRLMNLYLYSDNPISEKDFIIRKQGLDDYLKEINENLGMIDRGSGIETISDENFIKRASYFIMSKELAGKDYIYFKKLAMDMDAEVLKDFFHEIIDSIVMDGSNVKEIIFRNGLAHTFYYKESEKPEA
ncbi:MAG: recombinase family protein [Blautia sp.]